MAMCALFATQAYAQEKQTLRLVQTIPLPGVKGRLDHMGVDVEQKQPTHSPGNCQDFSNSL
jgi:hypothetical protein